MRSSQRPSRPAVVAGALLLLGSLACADPRLGGLRADTDEYIVGVQYEDAAGLVKRWGPFRAEIAVHPEAAWQGIRERHEEMVVKRFAEYEEAKASGRFPLADDGITLLQALAVGKGVYYVFEDVHLDRDSGRAVAIMHVTLDYEPHRFDVFPQGTKVFLVGEPLGTLHTVTLGDPAPAEPLRLLSRIELEWTLVWRGAMDVYPDGWSVESIRPRAGSATFVSWSPPLSAGAS